MSRARKPNPISKYRNVEAIETADIVGVSAASLRGYAARGCPRNGDGTYDTAAVVEWMQEDARGTNKSAGVLEKLTATRMEKQIEMQDILISAKKGEMMPVSELDIILGERASHLHDFFVGSFPANAHFFVDKTVEEIQVLLLELARQACDAWLASPVAGDADGDSAKK